MSEMSENTTKSSSFVVANEVGYNNKIQQLGKSGSDESFYIN